MIQFIRFATVDPDGFALVKLDDISSFQTGPVMDEVEHTRLITNKETYIIVGSIDFIIESMRGLVGSEYDMLPEGPLE